MKKHLSLVAFAAISFAAFGATMQSVNNLQPGAFEVKSAGKLTSVDVFSVAATGTVKIDRVVSMEHFTNCYDTTSAVVTNVVETKVYDDVFYRGDGVMFTNVGVTVYAPDSIVYSWETATGHNGMLTHSTLTGIWMYMEQYDSDTDHWYYGDRGGQTTANAKADYLRFGQGANAVEFSRQDIYNHSTFATNVVTVVTTNSVTQQKAYDLVVTNAVLNGSCSGGAYHGEPASGTWLFPGDKLNFSGTAVGGSMRVVIE